MPFFRPRTKDVDPKERALWGDLTSLGLVFPLAIALGFFLGRWIGGWFGHPAAGQWIGLVWGVATAFWELYKTTKRLDRLNPPDPEAWPLPPEDDDDRGRDA